MEQPSIARHPLYCQRLALVESSNIVLSSSDANPSEAFDLSYIYIITIFQYYSCGTSEITLRQILIKHPTLQNCLEMITHATSDELTCEFNSPSKCLIEFPMKT